jgi:antigen 43
VAISTTVSNGEQLVYGVSSDGNVAASGTQSVGSGGTAANAVIGGGGYELLESGGTAFATVISGGGTEYVEAGGSAAGANVNGGNLYVQSAGTADVININGGFVDLLYSAIVTNAITFISGGILQIDNTTMPAATISGLASGDMIDLTGLNSSGATYTLRPGNVFDIVVAGGQSYDLHFDPSQNLSSSSPRALAAGFKSPSPRKPLSATASKSRCKTARPKPASPWRATDC